MPGRDSDGRTAQSGGTPSRVGSARPYAPITSPDVYRALLDSMSEGVSLAREDGIIVFTNPAEDRMFGYARGELLGQHVSVQNAYPPEENARIVSEVIAELKDSGAWRGEWLNRRKDGSLFTTTSRISAVEINGQPYWLCVQDDVSEEKAATAALRDSEARLEIATRAAEIGIWDWDLLTGRMDYSVRAKEICGFAPDSPVTLEDARRITHPEDHPFTAAQARRALDPAIRERKPYEYRLVRPDGAVRWALAHGEAIFAEVDGKIRAVRYLGTIQDITERRRLEEAERLAAQRLRLAIDAGRMAVWEVDIASDTLSGSPELNRLLGFREHETPSLADVRAGYFPGEQERLQAAAQDLMARNEQFMEAEFRYRRPDGRACWMLLRCEIIYDADGHATKALGVLSDITDRRQMEADLRALNETLESRVEERTAELAAANRQLMNQIEERQKVEATLRHMQRLEALGQLTAGIAHDFNNLLTVVLGSVRFFERELAPQGVDPKVHERIGYMRAAAERGATLTAQLLAFSRNQLLEPKVVIINDLINAMASLLKSTIGGSVRVSMELEPDLWTAVVDPTQVELTVLNLAINARDAVQVGGSLIIRTANVELGPPASPDEPQAGQYIVLSVSDNGTGIPEEVLARAFEPFFTTKPVGKGSGLGLAQVYGFAKQSGGGVRIDTRMGEGTTVSVFLPRAQCEQDADEVAATGSDQTAAAPVQGMRVLLVDDDAAVRRIVAEMLMELGCEVVEADSGPAALELPEFDHAFDLAVVDFAMPGMNGAELAQKMLLRRPDLPLLFVTGYAETGALQGIEADRIIHKPLRPEDLAGKVRRALSGAARAATP